MQTNEHGQSVGDEVPDWAPRDRPRGPLQGRWVRLVPVAPEHAAPLFGAVCGPDDAALWTYRPTYPPTSVAEMAADPVGVLSDRDDGLTYAVEPTGRSAEGLVSFFPVVTGHGVVEISSVLLARSLQRTTAATEAIHLMLGHAFDDLGYRRVEWKCDSLNEPSRQAALRLGFTYEGRFRRHLVIKDRSRDTDWFAITDADWPRVRETHERWLDPGNFDDDGRQHRSLRELRNRPARGRVVVGEGDAQLDERLGAELARHNTTATPGTPPALELTARLLDDTGGLVGGLSGWTWGSAAGLAMTWVNEDARGLGTGAELLDAFEVEARDRGCTHVFVTSFTFQAPAFYERHGYREIGRWEDLPVTGEGDVQLRKDL